MKTINNLGLLVILIFNLTLSSCEEKESIVKIVPEIEKDVFELIWNSRHEPGKEILNLNNGKVYNDWYLFSGNSDEKAKIVAYNTKTGNIDWVYDHAGKIRYEVDKSVLFENIYIAKCSGGIFAINMDTQEFLWEIFFDDIFFSSGLNLLVEDGFIYHHGTKNNYTLSSIKQMLKIDPYTGGIEYVYEIPRTESNAIGMSAPSFYTNHETNHKIMIVNRFPKSGITPPESIQDIIAVDLNTKDLIWETKNFTQNYASNHNPPIIYKDIVISGGDWSMYAFNKFTGEELWRTPIPGYIKYGTWTTTNHLIHDNKLYVNPVGFNLMCLNPENGEIIWNTEDSPNCSKNMYYYEKEDYLVFTSWGNAAVMVVDALTGETILKEQQYDNSHFHNDTVYDPETDMFFTSTYKHAVGFKINRKPN